MSVIAKQLYRLMAHRLLDRQRKGRALTVVPVVLVRVCEGNTYFSRETPDSFEAEQ
jgi:hypothetical protein